MSTLKLFVDVQNKRLVSAFNSRAAYTLPSFYLGDTGLAYEVHLLTPSATGSIDRPYEYVDPTGATIDLALGLIDQAPTAGTFTLTDTQPGPDETTGAIAYNASASTVQIAVRAGLPTNYGSCTVTGDDGGPWTIDRVTTGAIVALGGDGTALSPDSFVGIIGLRAGTSTLSSRQRIRLLQQPACYDTASGTLPVAAVTVTTKQSGSATANEVQRVSINSDSYDGSFSLTSTTLGAGNATTATTGPIAYNATAAEAQTIINAGFGTDNGVAVTQVNAWTWDVEFTGTNVDKVNMATMTGDASGLNVPVGVTGTLDLNTATALGIVGEETSVAATFEIQQTRSGSVTTLYQAGTTIVNDLIDPQSTGATELPGYYTIAQADALFAAVASPNTFTDTNTFDDVILGSGIQADSGGNARGTDAVDLQRNRSVATQVASGDRSFLGGGDGNRASASDSAALGGAGNVNSGAYSASVGGDTNTNSNDYAASLGGVGNSNSATASASVGGVNNANSGTSSASCGGSDNINSGPNAASLGGTTNTNSGIEAASIGGTLATAHLRGQVVSGADASRQHTITLKPYVDTTNATPTALFLNGTTERMTIPTDQAWLADICVHGRSAGGTEYAAYHRSCLIENTAGTTQIRGAVSTIGTDVESDAALDVGITADNTNDALIVTVTGKAATNMRWQATIQLNQITYA